MVIFQAKTKFGLSALHLAAAEDELDCIDHLLKAKASVDAVDDEGCTPLYHAASNGNVKAAELLIAAGADVNHMKEYPNCPLVGACKSGQLPYSFE